MLISAIWYINSRVDLLILGALKSHADVGVYAVVLRVAGLVMLATFTVNTIIAPRIAAYHHQGDHARLQRLVVASTQRTFFLCLPLGLILVVAGGPLLGLVFGSEFASGWAPLAILVSAQLFCIMCGPTAIILNMAGLERITNRTFAFATLVNIVLNFIPDPGGLGSRGRGHRHLREPHHLERDTAGGSAQAPESPAHGRRYLNAGRHITG